MYSDIALIAHSQGGLVARQYIAERLNSGQPLRVSRLLTFGTPHQGSGLATWLSRIPLASQQTEDLDPNSEFLQALAVAWGQAKPELRGVLTKYVVAANDAIVGQVLEGNHDVFLVNAKETAADADDRGRYVAVAIDHKICDIADHVIGRIINTRLIDIRGEPLARRNRGLGEGEAAS
jgi:pimeloyl-ACP methyl ester carboxylesterase